MVLVGWFLVFGVLFCLGWAGLVWVVWVFFFSLFKIIPLVLCLKDYFQNADGENSETFLLWNREYILKK